MKKLTREEFLNRLHPELTSNFKILTEYSGSSNKTKLLHLETNTIFICSTEKLRQGRYPRDKHCTDRYLYFKTILNKKRADIKEFEIPNNRNNKIIVIDNNGFKYKISFANLLKGAELGLINSIEKNRLFKYKAAKVHANKYCYTQIKYLEAHSHMKVVCKKHGLFKVTSSNHLKGHGCFKCGRELIKRANSENPSGWSYTSWEKAGNRSKRFDSFKVYIIKCTNIVTSETFYKIGKTFLKVKQRFPSKHILPYDYEIIDMVIGESRYISELEHKYHNENKQFKYLPLLQFEGMNECFTEYNIIK